MAEEENTEVVIRVFAGSGKVNVSIFAPVQHLLDQFNVALVRDVKATERNGTLVKNRFGFDHQV
jgi:hypothetical protein